LPGGGTEGGQGIFKNTFPKDVQDKVPDVFKAFAAAGIKYFISIKPASAVTAMGVRGYESKVGPSGIKLVDAPSIEGAKAFLLGELKK
jgi:hypothetical protein